MEALNFLKSNIKSDMPLLSIVDIFSRMCRMDSDCEEEMFLFESGIQVPDEQQKFVFSTVRQFNCRGDEFMQLHLDISYRPTNNNKNISECSWHENYGDMIQAALLSKAFELCKKCDIIKIDIWADKT